MANELTGQLIHEWKNTLCVHSKYKDDLVHIRDMHRLLSYKGGFNAGAIMEVLNKSRLPLQVLRRGPRNGIFQPQ